MWPSGDPGWEASAGRSISYRLGPPTRLGPAAWNGSLPPLQAIVRSGTAHGDKQPLKTVRVFHCGAGEGGILRCN